MNEEDSHLLDAIVLFITYGSGAKYPLTFVCGETALGMWVPTCILESLKFP